MSVRCSDLDLLFILVWSHPCSFRLVLIWHRIVRVARPEWPWPRRVSTRAMQQQTSPCFPIFFSHYFSTTAVRTTPVFFVIVRSINRVGRFFYFLESSSSCSVWYWPPLDDERPYTFTAHTIVYMIRRCFSRKMSLRLLLCTAACRDNLAVLCVVLMLQLVNTMLVSMSSCAYVWSSS